MPALVRRRIALAVAALVCHLGAAAAQTAAPSALRAVDSATGADVVGFGGRITTVTALALSADGRQLAAITSLDTAGQRLQLWAADASEPQATLWTSPERIDNVCFSPDGKYVAASDRAGTVVVWEARSHAEVARLRSQPAVHALAFSPNGDWLAESGRKILLHRIGDWRTSQSIAMQSEAQSIAFTSDGSRIVAALSNGSVVWLAAREGPGTPLRAVRRPPSTSPPIVVSSSDGSAIAVAGDGGASVFSSADGSVIATIKESFGGGATAAAFQPGTRIFALAGIDGMVRLFDADTARVLRMLDFGGSSVRGLAFTPDGRRLIVGTEARTATALRGPRLADRPRVDLTERHDYAIMFATDEYDHWPALVNPIADAETLKDVLEKDYAFDVRVVRNPTRDQILDELRAAQQRSFGPADQLMIFFAGHGTYDRQNADGYVVARDSLEDDRNHTSQISYSDLRTKIDSLQAGHILVAMDVCQGGMMLASALRGEDEYGRLSLAELLSRKIHLRTRKILASGLDDYVSDGVPGRHSPFVSGLLAKLRSYGGTQGYITSAALFGSLENVKPGPVMGDWGNYEPGSDFFFIPREMQTQLAAALRPAPPAARTATAADPMPAVVRVNTPSRRSIAVLPFRNLRKQDADQYLSSVVGAQLWSELNAVPTLRTLDLRQVEQTAHEQHWDKPDEMSSEQLAWAAQNLGADLVLTGAYARLGTDDVSVQFQVIDTRDGRVLHRSSDSSKEGDLASTVLRREGARLRRVVGGDDSALPVMAVPQDREAAAIYANALQKIRVNEFAAARDLLEKVVVVEPTFALGHARLAEVYASLGYDARARNEARAAYESREGVGPNEARLIEGRYFASRAEWNNAIAAFNALWSYNADTIDYVLDLAQTQISSGQALQAVTLLQQVSEKAPAPADALRLDMATARAYMDMADLRHLKSTAERAVASAEHLRSDALLAEALLYESIASRRLGDAKRALEAAQRGLHIIANSHALLRARLLTAVGSAYGQLGDVDNDIRNKTEALKVARAAEDQKDLAGALTNLANIMLTRGDLDQVASYYREAIEVATKIEDLQGQGLAKFNLANLLKAKGELSNARDLLEQSERLYRAVHNEQRVGRASHEIALILLENGQVADAHRRLVAARDAMQAAGGEDVLASVMLSLGDALAVEDDLKGASDQYEQVSAICRKAQDAECTAAYQVSAAWLLLADGQFQKAAGLASAAADAFHAAESPDGEVEARAALAAALLGQNLPRQALVEVEKAEALKAANRLANLYLGIQAARVRGRIDGGQPRAIERLQALVNEARQIGARKAQLEAELALVEIDGANRAALKEALRKEASDLGYALIARLASR